MTDLSQPAIDRRKAFQVDLLARLRAIDVTALDVQDRVSRDVLEVDLGNAVRVAAFHGEWMPVSQTDGPQIGFVFLAKSTLFRRVADYDAYLKRLHGLSLQIGQVKALMVRGIATGWVWPAVAIERVPAQIDAWLTDDVTRNPAYRPFADCPADVPADARTRRARGGA